MLYFENLFRVFITVIQEKQQKNRSAIAFLYKKNSRLSPGYKFIWCHLVCLKSLFVINIKKLDIYFTVIHINVLFIFEQVSQIWYFLHWASILPKPTCSTWRYTCPSVNGNSILPVTQAMILESPLTPFFLLYPNIQMIKISYCFSLWNRCRIQYFSFSLPLPSWFK